ncbi:hypothetical protein C5S29_12390 [ANME-1 cluster archaeon GoMg3.2]|nr:hypothetical protein [ANME-1 cluster archaeon GoMg3.2]
MRGKVAVAVIVVLACALFLVPYASAACKVTILDTWVENPSGEVLDESTYGKVTDNFIYHIEFKIDDNSMWPVNVNVNLTFGSNYENKKSCQDYGKSQSRRLMEPTAIFSFDDLSLLPLEDCDEEFKEFTDGKSGWKWDKCWYEFDVESVGVISCGGDNKPVNGIPMLTSYKETFDDQHVEQNRTLKGMSFDYSVFVWANLNDSIMLQVWNYTNSGWDEKELKEYPVPLRDQELTWHAVALTSHNLDRAFTGKYRFVGSYNESEPFHGGHIGPTIKEEFYMPSVYYNKTIRNLSFDYEVTTWVNMVEDSTILLEVWNFSANSWEPKGIRGYTRPGYNQTLRWAGINLGFDHFDDHLRGKYRFVGTYGESSPTDKGHHGPIIEEDYYNLDVTPKEGTNADTFNYSVTVNANVCDDKIELQVRNHTSDTWDTKGTRGYRTPNINETLTWQEIRLNSHELDRFNDSIYKFVGISESSESEGPFYPIDLRWRNNSVTPNGGLYNYQFDYSIEVNSTKEIDVKLRVDYPHEGEAVISDPMKNYTDRGNWKPLCWVDTQPFDKEDEGSATYKFEFYYKGIRINETELYSGPSIGIADFKDASLEPEIGTRETEFTYRVLVKAVKPEYITLTVYDSKGDNVAERKSKDKTTTEWKLFEFENVPFKVLPALGIASYEFLTGKNTKVSFDGPELIEEEFGELSVDPEEGTNYTPFNFSAEYKTSKPEYVTLWAKCDDGNWEAVERKPVVSEQSTILFSAKTPCEAFETVCWKCTGIVSESGITCTNWDIGLKWQNRSFSPKEGWWNDGFDFSVRLSANVPGDVVLMVKEEGSNEWMAVGNNRPYTGSPNPQTLTWENERIFNFNNPYEGNTSYNFSFYWGKTGYAATSSYGPKLYIPLNISISSADVIPNDGVLYNFKDYIFTNNNNPLFNFSITMTADKQTAVKLVLFDPEGNEHTLNDDQKCEYTTPYQPLNCLWTMIELPSEGDVGEWEHTYAFYDTRFGGWKMSEKRFKGPDIIAVFNSYELVPAPPIPYGEECNVTICMNGLEKMDVTLEAYNLIHNRWESVGMKFYESKGEKCLSWVIDTFEVPFDKLRLKW